MQSQVGTIWAILGGVVVTLAQLVHIGFILLLLYIVNNGEGHDAALDDLSSVLFMFVGFS